MAPRRGGGSSHGGDGSGSSLSVSCPNPFPNQSDIVHFANICVFLVLTFLVMISLCCIRKKRGKMKKRLTGPVFLLSLLFTFIGYAVDITGSMLYECDVTNSNSFYNWVIAYDVFFNIGTYLLLVVVFWGINSALSEHFGSGQNVVKMVSIAVLGIMGCLTAACIGLQSYSFWTSTSDGILSGADGKYHQVYQLITAYLVLYLLSVVAGGGISIGLLVQTQSRHIPSDGLLPWVAVVSFCMVVQSILPIVFEVTYLQNKFLGTAASEALGYIENFFQTFAFIAILVLASSRTWDNAVVNPNPNIYQPPTYLQGPVQYAPVPPQQQQYAYSAPPGQQYYYQQQQQPQLPVYNNATELANARQVTELK